MNPPFENYSSAPFHVATVPSDPFADLVSAPEPAPETSPADIVPFAPAGDFIRHYGLRENPFADSVHPAFFFRTEAHAGAFRDMMLAVES